MEWWAILIIVLGAPVMLLPIVVIWYINVVGFAEMIKERRHAKRLHSTIKTMFCSIDTDCPEGYLCVDGVCVPAK